MSGFKKRKKYLQEEFVIIFEWLIKMIGNIARYIGIVLMGKQPFFYKLWFIRGEFRAVINVIGSCPSIKNQFRRVRLIGWFSSRR